MALGGARRRRVEEVTRIQEAGAVSGVSAEVNGSNGIARKRRLYLIALFFSVAVLFLLLLVWQMRTESGEVYNLLSNLAGKTEPIIRPTTKSTSLATSPQLNQVTTPLVQAQPAQTVSISQQQPVGLSLDGLYVRPQDQPATGDITGTFNDGLSIASDAVALGADTTGNYVASVIAGLGIDSSGSGEDATVSLAVKPGDGIVVDSNGVGVAVQSGGGLRVDPTGLALVDTCSDGQVLKWVAVSSTWVCGVDNSGGGSLTVRETDGSPSVSPTGLLEFGPATGSSDEFVVTDQGGSTSRVRLGTAVPLTTANSTITGGWTFSSALTASGGLSLGGNTYTNLAGTGLSFAAGTLATTLGTAVDTSEIIDGTITAADIANGTVTFDKLGQNGCTTNQIPKWNGSAWACAADVDTDTNTTYSAGSGLALTGTTFSLDLTNPNTWSGLQTFSGGLSLGGNTYTNLAGTGLSFSSGTLSATLGTSIDSSEIVDGTIVAGDITNGTLTLNKLGQNGCTTNQVIKWNGSAWACAADVDTDTTYSAGTGLSLVGTTFSLDSSLAIFKTIGVSLGSAPVADSLTDTLSLSSGNGINVTGDATADSVTFSLNLASGSGLMTTSGALSLLDTCSGTQYLSWSSGTSSWVCTSLAATPNIFQTVSGDSGSSLADSSSDTITLAGGNGLSSTASDVNDTVTFNIDLASGSGLAFSSGALTLQSCSDGQVLKRVSSSWACAASLPAAAYKQQLSGADNVSVGASLTPLLTNGSGTAQSLGVTMGSGNAVSFSATVQVSSTLATGPVTYVVIRDDNHDNDCATGGGDGTQVGGQVTSFLASIAQSFTTTITFTDTAPSASTNYYQLCASTTIGVGTTTATNRALKLEETSV
jgi:hypothetical protein